MIYRAGPGTYRAVNHSSYYHVRGQGPVLTRDTETQPPHPGDMPSCGGPGPYREEELSVQEGTVCLMSSILLNPMEL